MNERRLYPSRALHAQVAHSIGRRIVAGSVAEGALLPREAELAEQFGVSRQAVREALKVLAAKGLVNSRRRTGTYVLPRNSWNLLDPDVLDWHAPATLTQEFLGDLVELRTVLEPAAAELAAKRATPEQVDAIHTALQEMRRAIDDRPAFIRADVEFHTAICVASGNTLFDRLSVVFAPALSASFTLQVQAAGREIVTSVTLPRHTAVYEAIAARDGEGARREMENLLSGSARQISSMRQQRRNVAN